MSKSRIIDSPKLSELVLTGWAGNASAESGVTLTRYESCCGHITYSGVRSVDKLIDGGQWDGSDFFIVWPMPKFILITQRVADFLQKQRLTGFTLTSIRKL